MGSRVLQEKLCHLKSTCIQAKQLQYNNDIHYVLMIFIFLHIRRFCISKGGSVPLPSDMRGSTVFWSQDDLHKAQGPAVYVSVHMHGAFARTSVYM